MFNDASASEFPFHNGTVWSTYSVCYRIEASAAGMATEITKAADDWTAASTGGFEFVKTTSTSCANTFSEGYIDGYRNWYGYTIIQTDNGEAGCDPDNGCTQPTPDSEILQANTVLESFTCGSDNCTCYGETVHGEFTYNDPIGCPPVTYNPCGMMNPPNTVPLAYPYGLRWNTPGLYETALHEFGHWLWLDDHALADPAYRESAMEWLSGQPCGFPNGQPDFYTLFDVDEIALNELYP
jgi:hypothetical protein